MQNYDLVVIGGGSAGFNAARVSAEHGQRVAIIDGARRLGGLCILNGCMPSKTLIYTAEVLHSARQAARFGIHAKGVAIDMTDVARRKRRIIDEFASFRAKQLKSGNFDLIRAKARFIDPRTVELSNGRRVRGNHFLVSTGSRASVPPISGLAESEPWTSDDVLDLDFVPESVIVLGGGVVACELAQFLSRIGTRVTLIQRSRNILRDHSEDASTVIRTAFAEEGIELYAGCQLARVARSGKGFMVEFEHDGKTVVRRSRHLFNALGREPNTKSLNLDAAGVRTRPNGQIIVNRWQQTNVPNIYAAGDCCGPVEIVHVAIQQGELAARHSAGHDGLKTVNYNLILNVVFTDPQLATIGLLESDLSAKGRPFLSASYPFADHGKSILMEAKLGFVKVLADPKSGRIFGAEIAGKDAGELIHSFSTPMAMKATVFDMLRAPWYHPTLAEIVTYPLEEIAQQIRDGR